LIEEITFVIGAPVNQTPVHALDKFPLWWVHGSVLVPGQVSADAAHGWSFSKWRAERKFFKTA
jgi:hypothetical protein